MSMCETVLIPEMVIMRLTANLLQSSIVIVDLHQYLESSIILLLSKIQQTKLQFLGKLITQLFSPLLHFQIRRLFLLFLEAPEALFLGTTFLQAILQPKGPKIYQFLDNFPQMFRPLIRLAISIS